MTGPKGRKPPKRPKGYRPRSPFTMPSNTQQSRMIFAAAKTCFWFATRFLDAGGNALNGVFFVITRLDLADNNNSQKQP